MKAPSIAVIKITWKKLSDPYFAGCAAEIAFWLILSLMPATIVLTQLLQIFMLSVETVQEIIIASMSGEVYGIVAPLLEYDSRKGVTVLLVVLALVAGSNVVFALMRIINLAYGNISNNTVTIVQTIKDRLKAILMTLIILVAMIFALFILVYGEFLVKTTLMYTNDYFSEGYTFSEVWFGVRWVIAFILFFIMVFSLYYILPRSGVSYRGSFKGGGLTAVKNIFTVWLKGRRMEYMRAMPGSIFSAVALLIVTRIFTLIVGNVAFGNISILYGGLGSVVLLLLWLYSMGYVLIAGIQLNAAYLELDEQQEEAL